MQKVKYVFIYFCIILAVIIYSVFLFMPFEVENVTYELDGNEIYATITIKGNTKNGICISNYDNYDIVDNTCIVKITNEENEVIIKNRFYELKQELSPNISKVMDFGLKFTKTYIVKGETKEIAIDNVSVIGSPIYEVKLTSSDESIVKIVDGNKIKGMSDGEVTVTVSIDDVVKNVKVISTTLITKPKYDINRKPLPCKAFTKAEAKLLDNLLEYRVKEAGYKTRAGAVAAARFLTLEFPYRVDYFYENGRVHKSGVNYVDGEGRYYKKGLYLSTDKYKDIKASYTGPAIWGCPLRNLEDEPRWGYKVGMMVSNGLDCSGFVSWVLVQAGFNPGDIGAGENEDQYQLTDLGDFTKLSMKLINSDKIKVGDLFNYWGHISILVAMDDEYYYIAESLPNFDGVVANKYKKTEVMDTFPYVVLMDRYYKEDGNYTEFYK